MRDAPSPRSDYGFDPLGLSKGSGFGAMRTLQTAEIKHGRAAMMAITGCVATHGMPARALLALAEPSSKTC